MHGEAAPAARLGAQPAAEGGDPLAHPEQPDTGHSAPTPGLGLLGMRERVSALGGRLRAEPRTAGGFTVQAELPTDGAS